MDIHKAFQIGAQRLAQEQSKYTELHKSHGIVEAEWELLTQDEYWTAEQARSMRTILANVLEVSMTVAGLPAIPLPGQYAAALIATVVKPCNRFVACQKCPDTFDAVDASGIISTSEAKPMKQEQITSLVLAYSGGLTEEPVSHRLPKEVSQQVISENKTR